MLENITISGQVRGYESTVGDSMPIFNIKVSAYHDWQYIDHVFTNKEGKYQICIPSGNPITVCFDTHYPLKNNTRKWHPSVVANIDTDQDILLNRFLMEVGESKGWTFNIDALTAYQFILMWSEKTDLDKTLAEYNSFRVSQLMFVQPELIDIQTKLMEYFKRKSNCD